MLEDIAANQWSIRRQPPNYQHRARAWIVPPTTYLAAKPVDSLDLAYGLNKESQTLDHPCNFSLGRNIGKSFEKSRISNAGIVIYGRHPDCRWFC